MGPGEVAEPRGLKGTDGHCRVSKNKLATGYSSRQEAAG